MKKMVENKWYEELLLNDIDGFVTFDNFLLTRKLLCQVKEAYDGEGLPRPFTMQWAPSTNNLFQPEAEILDKVLLSSPRETYVRRTFHFPTKYIGFQGLYNVFEFLLSLDPEFSDLVHSNRLYVPRQVIRTITDEMVFRLRNKQRAEMMLGNINQIHPTCVFSFHLVTLNLRLIKELNWQSNQWYNWSRNSKR